MSISEAILDDIFLYHAPTPEQVAHMEVIRKAARVFAGVMVAHSPSCPDQTAALRKLREAVMTINQGIIFHGISSGRPWLGSVQMPEQATEQAPHG